MNYVTGFNYYYRCNGTGNPTKTHIINPDTGYSFCGYKDDPYAQEFSHEEWTAHRIDCCKHCLKAMDKRITKLTQ